jgi:hypothetical protein
MDTPYGYKTFTAHRVRSQADIYGYVGHAARFVTGNLHASALAGCQVNNNKYYMQEVYDVELADSKERDAGRLATPAA